jgi:hypothetical protein
MPLPPHQEVPEKQRPPTPALLEAKGAEQMAKYKKYRIDIFPFSFSYRSVLRLA